MLPYLAQGANQALEDAAALAYFLSRKIDVSQALRHYGQHRRGRVLKVQKAAQRNARLYHLSNGPVKFLTHSALNLASRTKPNFLLAQLDWLYDYEVPR